MALNSRIPRWYPLGRLRHFRAKLYVRGTVILTVAIFMMVATVQPLFAGAALVSLLALDRDQAARL